MATYIRAVAEYRPRLVHNQTADLELVAEWLSSRSGLNTSEVTMVLLELKAAILFFCRSGTPVKLAGIGRFAPYVRGDGRMRISFRQDSALRNGINAAGAYHGRMANAGNIGLSPQELKELWDEDHPNDPLVIPQPS